jgi:DNA-binding GntR family transcriptional regulator
MTSSTPVASDGRSGSRRTGGDLAARAYREIRKAIIDLDFQPGQQLQETFLAQWLGTSRTPVREALHRLQGEGLIEGLSSRGAVVAQVSVDDIENAYLVIEVVEGLASRLAAERRTADDAAALRACLDRLSAAAIAADLEGWASVDADLHETIRAIARNAKLDQVAHIAYPVIERVRSMYLREGHEPDRLGVAMAAHRDLVEAILAGEGERAEGLARALFTRARQDNVRLLRHWVAPLRRSF